jgi:Tol biopolymer transport system component
MNKKPVLLMMSLLVLISMGCVLISPMAEPELQQGQEKSISPFPSIVVTDQPVAFPPVDSSQEVDEKLKIAFCGTGWAVPGAGVEIFAMHTDGSGIVPISKMRERDSEPAWSPDGKTIVFASNRDGNYEIYRMDANGQNQIRLTNDPASDHAPSLSIDGRIVFSSDRDGDADLYIMNEDGSALEKLIERDAQDYDPVWSPDGTRIAFSSFGGAGGPGIYVMDLAGNLAHLAVGPYHNPAWSPDGTSLAMDGEPAGCKFEIYTMQADGSNIQAITTHPDGCGGYNKHPSWSADGQWLVYYSLRAGRIDNLYKIRLDGGEEIQLTDTAVLKGFLNGPRDPVWSPVP